MLLGAFKTTDQKTIHPGRLTWNLQITHLERKMIFQTSMSMFHVNLPGCTCQIGRLLKKEQNMQDMLEEC